MAFESRLFQTNTLVTLTEEFLWLNEQISQRLAVVPFGYETHIPEVIRAHLRYERTNTAKHIKFAPDFFLIDKGNPKLLCLFEYKCTQTPIYSTGRISQLGRENNITDLKWQDVGQWEEDAYDNYLNLASKLDLRVAILNYCAFHERLITLDFVQNVKLLFRSPVTSQTETGSRTPFVNLDLNSMRTLEEFLEDEFSIPRNDTAAVGQALRNKLIESLPVKHDRKSPLFKS